MNTKALFHDMTLDYLRPAEPDKNRKTQVRFRCSKDDRMDITLVWGNERFVMRHAETDGEFDYYDVTVTASEDVSVTTHIRAKKSQGGGE